MQPLGRRTTGTKQTNHEDRIRALERRVYPQVQIGVAPLESFFGTFPTGPQDVACEGDPTDIFVTANAQDWRILNGGIHVPNIASPGAGFFQCFASCSFNEYLGYESEVAGVPQARESGGPRIRMQVYDQGHTLIDDFYDAIWHSYSIRWEAVGGMWEYHTQALFWNGMPFDKPVSEGGQGWHAHFKCAFNNDSGVAGRTLAGGYLTVMRHAPVTGQLS